VRRADQPDSPWITQPLPGGSGSGLHAPDPRIWTREIVSSTI
jgi:hypothetical protein